MVCVSGIISPGAGIDGSLSCRFMSTAERRRPVCGEDLFLDIELFEEPA